MNSCLWVNLTDILGGKGVCGGRGGGRRPRAGGIVQQAIALTIMFSQSYPIQLQYVTLCFVST